MTRSFEPGLIGTQGQGASDATVCSSEVFYPKPYTGSTFAMTFETPRESQPWALPEPPRTSPFEGLALAGRAVVRSGEGGPMHAWMSVVCGGCQQSCQDLGCRVDLEGILSFQQCKSSDLSPLPFFFFWGGGVGRLQTKKGID